MSDDTRESRLPPPAFPPGQRRHPYSNSAPRKPLPKPAADEGALISPNDPIPPRKDPVEQAFISPDEPIPERKIELTPEFAEHSLPTDPSEGEVVGMDLATQADPFEIVWGHDPYVVELGDSIERLADSLRRDGEAALKTQPSMSAFEATLRAYCVGYLTGRRAQEVP